MIERGMFSFIYIAPFTIKIVSRCFSEAETQRLNTPGEHSGEEKKTTPL